MDGHDCTAACLLRKPDWNRKERGRNGISRISSGNDFCRWLIRPVYPPEAHVMAVTIARMDGIGPVYG